MPQIDLISPLITQLTYEGLIDEMFGIRNAAVSLPADRFMEGAATAMAGGSGAQDEDEELSPPEQPGSAAGRKTIHLTSDEEMYAEIRDKNFNAVGPYLSREGLVSIETKTRRGQTSIAFSSSILFSPTLYYFNNIVSFFLLSLYVPPERPNLSRHKTRSARPRTRCAS